MKPCRLPLAVLLILGGLRIDAMAQTGAPSARTVRDGVESAAAKAAPPTAIPTVSLANVARQGFFRRRQVRRRAGRGEEATMGGAMYVEVMVPRQIRSPYPIVLLHGAGQTGVDWLQTPDGRPGWAYNFLDMGYVVYMTDFPARGRSQYVPGVDGPRT